MPLWHVFIYFVALLLRSRGFVIIIIISIIIIIIIEYLYSLLAQEEQLPSIYRV